MGGGANGLNGVDASMKLVTRSKQHSGTFSIVSSSFVA